MEKELTDLKNVKTYKCGVYFDLDKMCERKKSYDKSGIGFVEKPKVSHVQPTCDRQFPKLTEIGTKAKKVNHAFRYRYRKVYDKWLV